MTTLVTAAGFIGMHIAAALLGRGERVVGIDNFTPYMTSWRASSSHSTIPHSMTESQSQPDSARHAVFTTSATTASSS